LVLAATSAAAFVVMLVGRGAGARSLASAAAVASLRILIAPLFALAFAVSTVFAPSRKPRLALVAATAIEAMVFGGYFLLALTIGRAE
jgi:hypothetical protein